MSAFKTERVSASSSLPLSKESVKFDLSQLQQSYQMARIINHAQGIKVLEQASASYHWELNLAETTRIWTNGCIIRSQLMEECTKHLAFSTNNLLKDLLDNKDHNKKINTLTNFIQNALGAACPVPAHSAALNYFLESHSKQTSANMIQLQRDFFGQHSFERIDQKGSFSYPWE